MIAAAKPTARRGVSLVEVLVVLVILILGVFAISRLFPEGFASLNYSANRTLAEALARQNAEWMRSQRDNLPDAIVAVDPRTGLIRLDLSPAELRHRREINVLSDRVEDPFDSDVNLARRVIGEQFRLGPPTTFGGEPVSLHRALFSPIFDRDHTDPGGNVTIPAVGAYAGTPLSRRFVPVAATSFEALQEVFRLGPFGYGVNYDEAALYLPSTSYERRYKVEFTYRGAPDVAGQSWADNCAYLPPDSDPITDPLTGEVTQFRIQRFNLRTGVVDLVLIVDVRSGTINTTAPGAATPPPDCIFRVLPTGGELEPGSDFLYRRFRQIPVGTSFSADPYEFKLYDPVFGLFGFNPVAASLPLPRQSGRGITAKVDYTVEDWSILRQDEVIPHEPADPTAAEPFHSIRLATTSIKRYLDQENLVNFLSGGGNPNTTYEYQGLIRFRPAGLGGTAQDRPGTTGIDVVIVDLDTGLQIDSRSLQTAGPTQPPGTSDANGRIDYRAGVLHLRPVMTWLGPGAGGPGTQMASGGRRIRVYYRAENDMAVAASKPYSIFFRAQNPAGPGPTEYFPLAGGYLLFNPSDAEKTIAVDYSYNQLVNDPNNPGNPIPQTRIETGELQQIQPPGAVGDPGAGTWWSQLARAREAGVDPTSIQIIGVRGVSFHTRISWREGTGKRFLERSTVLTRSDTR